jgi:lysophospholipase L1-like esterase
MPNPKQVMSAMRANGGAMRAPAKKTQGFVEGTSYGKSFKDRLRQAAPLSPLGVGLNAGYAGYKYLTGENPLEDLKRKLDAKINPETDTGSESDQQFEKLRKGGAIRKARGGLARMAGGGQPSKVLSGNIMAGASWNSINPTLADRLTEATGMPTYNAAVGATTSADTYKQLIDFIEAGGSFEEGANVFLQAGGADFLKGVSRRDTEENLDKILTELEKQGVNVVLTGSPNASSYEQVISNNFDPESDPIYKNLVAKHSNVVLVDSMGEILQDKSLLDDPIHPNAEGWEVYNDSVLGALNQLKQREDQVVQKEEPVDIPQEIEKITQTSTPEITYTPTTEVEETVDIPEEIERITNKSPEQYIPDVQVDEYVSEDIPQINTEVPVEQNGYQAEQTYTPPSVVQETASVPYEPQEIASIPQSQPEVAETRSEPDYSRAYKALGGEDVVNRIRNDALGAGLSEEFIESVFSKYYSPETQEAKKGGAIRMQVGGLSTLARLGTAGTKLTKAEIAALRARGMGVPGIDFADPLKAPTMRMSEALGNVGAEGKFLNFTEADRSRVFAENMGGTGFTGLQNYSQPHKQARTVWGFGNQSTAEKKIRQNDPDNTIWTTYAGSPEQHKSNTVVVKDAVKTLQAANQAGTVNPEQIKLINQRIKQAKNDKGNPLFSDDFDITDPQAINAATTFERRTAISDALMGVGVKKPMISKEFKAANPNVKYSDASDISRILTRETDPVLANANTFDVGPHLFVMDNKIIHRADLNEAFPVQVTGDDLGMRFQPAPIRTAAPDFIKQKGYKPNDPINAWAMSRGNPRQFVDEKYLSGMQKEGYKDGGSTEPKPFHDFDQIMKRKDGGTVNQSFEQRLKSALSMAMGGEVSDNTMPDRTDSGNVNYGGQYATGGGIRMDKGGSYPPKKDLPDMSPQKYLELLALQPKLGLQSEKQIKAKLEEQYRKEKEEGFGNPQARIDRAIKTVTPFIGAGADAGNFVANIPHYATEGLSAVGNYAMSKRPSMSKPASVLDTEGTGDRVPKYPLQSLPEVEPFYGSAAMQRDAQSAGLMGDSESPVFDTAMAFAAPFAAYKAPRAIEGGLNAVTAAARRPFTPATMTTEAVSPDLAKFKNPAFQDYVTNQMIGEGAAVPMTTMGGRKTSQTRGQGVYLNEAKELEKNPMIGVNIPRAGNLATNKALRADIATAGQELGQEAMAAHRFVPMATNQIKDASAMMIRGQGGRPLTNKEVMAMANELPDMIVTHSPANGGLMVAPFGMTKGQVPEEFLTAQSVARKVLGKDANIQFGKADPNKDLMYMMRHQYAEEGGRGTSQGAQDIRNKLKRMDKNFPLARQ